MTTQHVTDNSFETDVISASKPVVVDFWAEWFGPCKQIAPALEEIGAEMSDQIQIAKINIDENPGVPGKYGVRGIPTLLLFQDGQVIAQKVGAMPKSQIVSWIKESI